MPDLQDRKSKDAGLLKKQNNRNLARQYTAASQEIGRPPHASLKDWTAAERCRFDFKRFCERYFAHVFTRPWAKCHITAIKEIQYRILNGLDLAIALPRGYGKTSLCRIACIWAALYGHSAFTFYMGANKDANAIPNLNSIKAQLLSTRNELFQADFWETLWPIVCAGGEARVCRGQKYDGNPTNLIWETNKIRLPTNPQSDGSGAIIKVAGLMGSFLGANETDPDGNQIRPRLVIPDDPQTPESARSSSMTASRIRAINSTIRGMKDVGSPMSIIMPCTVIRPGDLTDQMTNHEQYPEFSGIRTSMVERFPESPKWKEYEKRYKDDLKNNAGGARKYYRKYRKEMDAGAEVSWEHGYEPDKADSTLEYAMRYKISNPDYFWAECQNDPLPDEREGDRVERLDADHVMARVNNRPRGEAPENTEGVTVYIDCHDTLLYWAAVAFTGDSTGRITDYDTYPRQNISHFSLYNASRALAHEHSGGTKEAVLYQGLAALINILVERRWKTIDGGFMQASAIGIDQRYKSEVVQQVCYEHPHSNLLVPCFGQGIGARNVPISEYQQSSNRGDKIGFHWIFKRKMPERPCRALLVDANYWKTYIHERLSLGQGEPGAMTLFGDNPAAHRLFAEHIAAEYGVRTEGRGREVVEWTLPPSRPDNHWLDCAAGAACLASYKGIFQGDGRGEVRRQKQERRKLSDYRSQADGK